MLFAGIGFAGLAIGVGKLVSTKRMNPVKGEAYECGLPTEGTSWGQFNVGYYLFSLSFLIFDVEMVFLYPWAVNFRDYIMMNPESFTAMCIFIGILLVAYLYALGKGALNWHHDPR